MIATLLGMIMIVGAMMLLQFNHAYQMHQELRMGAMDLLTHEMEIIKHEFIYELSPYEKTVRISDNRTPNRRADDTTGTLNVEFMDRAGNLLADDDTILNVAKVEGRVEVSMHVTWNGRGRFKGRTYTERIGGYLVP